MSLGEDIADGFNESLDKAKEIMSDFINDYIEALELGDPDPVVEFEEFDYNKKFADTIVNSCYNSFSNGTIDIPAIGGGYPLVPTGTYASNSTVTCSWESGTDIQTHIDNIVSALGDMVPALGEEFDSESAEFDFVVAVADEIHAMVISGTISVNGVVGTFTIPGSPPVTSTVSINAKGSLSGSNVALIISLYAAFKLSSNDLIGDAIGAGIESYCLSLLGSVIGQEDAGACVGSGVGFVIT